MPKLILPDRHDPRLRLAAVTIALQVLGQTVLGFKLSIAQVAVTIGFSAALELAVVRLRRGAWVWPSSAILTGNSIALFLRATGTQHGDWWSLRGIGFFLLAAAVGLGSKYLLRVGGRHLYNPSNVGLVVVLLVAGPSEVFPQYLWWGPLDVPVALAWVVIVAGGAWVLRRLGMVPMVVSFALVFALLVATQAALGNCFVATWRSTPVCGLNYWIALAASPEVAIFVLLMMSDPRTVPAGGPRRMVFGAATALAAGGLIALQPAEWGVKLALLAGLVIACTLVPLLQRAIPGSAASPVVADAGHRPGAGSRGTLARAAPMLVALVVTLALATGVVLAAGSPAVLDADRASPGGGGGPRQ